MFNVRNRSAFSKCNRQQKIVQLMEKSCKFDFVMTCESLTWI